MAMFKLFGKKKKEPTFEEKVQAIQKQKLDYTVKQNAIKQAINGYTAQINKVVDKFKADPKNKFLYQSTKNMLKVLITKKVLYQKFNNIIEACKMIIDTNLMELKLSKGGKLIDSNFVANMEKMLGDCSVAIDDITAASQIEDLEAAFGMYTAMTGDSIDAESAMEVDRLIDEALGAVNNQNQNVEKVEPAAEKVGDQSFVDEIEELRRKLETKL